MSLSVPRAVLIAGFLAVVAARFGAAGCVVAVGWEPKSGGAPERGAAWEMGMLRGWAVAAPTPAWTSRDTSRPVLVRLTAASSRVAAWT